MQVTRRSVARGAAWSVPAVMTATAAPALAASANQCPPDSDLNNGNPVAGSTFSVGQTPSYSTSGGSLAPLSLTLNFNMFANCYSGDVSYYWNDFSIGAATIQTKTGTIYSSKTTTLGPVSSGGAKVGVPTSVTYQFANSSTSCSSLTGAHGSVPFRFVYTAPNGAVKNVFYRVDFTLSKGCTLLATNPGDWLITAAI